MASTRVEQVLLVHMKRVWRCPLGGTRHLRSNLASQKTPFVWTDCQICHAACMHVLDFVIITLRSLCCHCSNMASSVACHPQQSFGYRRPAPGALWKLGSRISANCSRKFLNQPLIKSFPQSGLLFLASASCSPVCISSLVQTVRGLSQKQVGRSPWAQHNLAALAGRRMRTQVGHLALATDERECRRGSHG